MTYEEFYGSSYEVMKKAEGQLLELIRQYPGNRTRRCKFHYLLLLPDQIPRKHDREAGKTAVACYM